MVTSNSASAASSSRAVASRRSRSSSVSVPRPTSRRTSSSHDGGFRKTNSASGIVSRTWRAPWRSISSSAGPPGGQRRARPAAARRAVAGRRARPPTRAARRRATMRVELLVGDEPVVDAVVLAGARRPGGRRDRDPDLGVVARGRRAATVPLPTAVGPASTTRRDRGSPRPRQSRAANSRSSAATCLVPRPRTRRLSAMPSRSISWRARTLPSPGIDCSRSTTRILPMTSLCWPSLEHVGDRGAGVLQPVLDLGPLPAGGGGLVEGRLALFGGERGQSHGAGPSGSDGRSTVTQVVNLVRTADAQQSGRERCSRARQRVSGVWQTSRACWSRSCERLERLGAADPARPRRSMACCSSVRPAGGFVAVVRRRVDAGVVERRPRSASTRPTTCCHSSAMSAGASSCRSRKIVERLEQRVRLAAADDLAELAPGARSTASQ